MLLTVPIGRSRFWRGDGGRRSFRRKSGVNNPWMIAGRNKRQINH